MRAYGLCVLLSFVQHVYTPVKYFFPLHINTAMPGPPKAVSKSGRGREGGWGGEAAAAVAAISPKRVGVAVVMPAMVVVMYVY